MIYRENMFLENSENLHQTAWRHIPEDCNLHSHLCENLKSSVLFQISIFEHVVNSNFEMPTRGKLHLCARFEVVTAVMMKIRVFWVVKLCLLLQKLPFIYLPVDTMWHSRRLESTFLCSSCYRKIFLLYSVFQIHRPCCLFTHKY
jgi:hypothetical protein